MAFLLIQKVNDIFNSMPQNASNILSDEKNFVPLYFENICNYKNKYIKRRLNDDIIIEYLKKLGIDLWEIDQSIVNSTAYKQNRW